MKKIVPKWPCYSRHSRNSQRLHAIDLEVINVLLVVAPQHARALIRPQPVVALAKRNFVPQQVIREVPLQQPRVVRRRNRPSRNRGLIRRRSADPRRRVNGDIVDVAGEKRVQRRRIPRRARRVLIFASVIQRESSRLRPRAESRVIIEPALVRPPVVVDDRLPQMKAVSQRRPADAAHLRVDAFQLSARMIQFRCIVDVRLYFLEHRQIEARALHRYSGPCRCGPRSPPACVRCSAASTAGSPQTPSPHIRANAAGPAPDRSSCPSAHSVEPSALVVIVSAAG